MITIQWTAKAAPSEEQRTILDTLYTRKVLWNPSKGIEVNIRHSPKTFEKSYELIEFIRDCELAAAIDLLGFPSEPISNDNTPKINKRIHEFYKASGLRRTCGRYFIRLDSSTQQCEFNLPLVWGVASEVFEMAAEQKSGHNFGIFDGEKAFVVNWEVSFFDARPFAVQVWPRPSSNYNNFSQKETNLQSIPKGAWHE